MQKKTKSPTTKDIALLIQLHRDKQLNLQPEFQRQSVWPPAAKSYLIDTILNDRPIPLFFMQRATSIQTGRSEYWVIDGQQRLRAIFEYIEGDFTLSEVSNDSAVRKYKGKKFSQLPTALQQAIYNYDLFILELAGYSEDDVKDIFARMNKYVVRLSKQELRHAKGSGKFKDLLEKIGKWSFWTKEKVFTKSQLKRMRADELSAELLILLNEGPQDKKSAVDLYYQQYQKDFPSGNLLRSRLENYLHWITEMMPEFSKTRYRRSNELYSLIGALDKITRSKKDLSKIDKKKTRENLLALEKQTKSQNLQGYAAAYVIAASKHTDDIGPRNTRIEVIHEQIKFI